jgi:N-acetylmuramoyl-L-alanine amidase
MLKYIYIVFLLLCTTSQNLFALDANLDLKTSGPDIEFSFKLNESVEYDFFTLSDPYRLIVDLKAKDVNLSKNDITTNRSIIRNIEDSQLNGYHRVTIEFLLPFQLIEVTMDKQSTNYNLKLIINTSKQPLYKNDAKNIDEFLDIVFSQEENDKITANNKTNDKAVLINKINNKSVKKPIIVIDAGHGGKDPGAVNRKGDKEKNITLKYATELANRLNQTKRYKVYLTRDKDKFVSLGGRQYYARRKNADLFISLHADSAATSKAKGLSIYTLSDRASDNVAAMLANKANKSDVIAGIDLTGENASVTDLMIDLSQKKGMQKSKDFADILHENIKNKIDTVSKAQRYAGFAVLKNSNMASILVELGFVSNKSDVKKLKSSSYRKTLTKAIKDSIDDYFGY